MLLRLCREQEMCFWRGEERLGQVTAGEGLGLHVRAENLEKKEKTETRASQGLKVWTCNFVH